MNPIVLIKDEFLKDANQFKAKLIELGFGDVVSPVDGVKYPGICMLKEQSIVDDISRSLNSLILSEDCIQEKYEEIKVNYLFARIMKKNHNSPHIVHEDSLMGKYSALVYLNEPDEISRHGTAFYTHLTNEIQESDYKSLYNWSDYLFVKAKFNRLLIHKSEYYHAALPSYGFGEQPENARMVLTCFFDLL